MIPRILTASSKGIARSHKTRSGSLDCGDVRLGSFSDLGARSCEVRFTPMSRHREFDRLAVELRGRESLKLAARPQSA